MNLLIEKTNFNISITIDEASVIQETSDKIDEITEEYFMTGNSSIKASEMIKLIISSCTNIAIIPK